ncbi:DMT family transporter [Shimia aestuarii]|uniref:DMT family transporter n=1 Tax=Shimia aestuarii TaxID=254406 RepID=UPI001FB39681|nr:DMT family transporter [Shimia aestuarii]
MLVAMAVIGFVDTFIGEISQTVGLWQFHAMRSAFMMPLLILMPVFGLGVLRPRRWRRVLARSLVLSTSMMLYFGALGLMPVAQALAGMFTSPIFVLLINVAVMGQRIGIWRSGAVLLGFAGILLVLQPGTAGFGPAMVMPVAAGFFYAVSAIATRSWCDGESAVTLLGANMAMLGVIGLVVALGLSVWGGGSTGFLLRGWTWDVGAALPWIVLQAVCSLGAVFLIVRAYQMDIPTNVAVFEYAVMGFGPVFAWLLWGQGLGIWQIAGIALIVVAGLVIALRSGEAQPG